MPPNVPAARVRVTAMCALKCRVAGSSHSLKVRYCGKPSLDHNLVTTSSRQYRVNPVSFLLFTAFEGSYGLCRLHRVRMMSYLHYSRMGLLCIVTGAFIKNSA